MIDFRSMGAAGLYFGLLALVLALVVQFAIRRGDHRSAFGFAAVGVIMGWALALGPMAEGPAQIVKTYTYTHTSHMNWTVPAGILAGGGCLVAALLIVLRFALALFRLRRQYAMEMQAWRERPRQIEGKRRDLVALPRSRNDG